jgi:hypothetical protein
MGAQVPSTMDTKKKMESYHARGARHSLHSGVGVDGRPEAHMPLCCSGRRGHSAYFLIDPRSLVSFSEDKLYRGHVRQQSVISTPCSAYYDCGSNSRCNTLRRSTSQNRSSTCSSHGTCPASSKSRASLCTARVPSRTTD